MKISRIILVFCLLTSLSSQAHQIESPSDFCEMAQGCTKKMKKLSREYNAGNLDFLKVTESAFSGSCFHLDPAYDPTYEHHGAFAFENTDGKTLAGGVFSFFYEEDPYKDFNTHDLVQLLKGNNGALTPTRQDQGHLRLDFIDPGSNISYWFRAAKNKKSVVLIGRQVGEAQVNLVFCELINKKF